MINLLVVLDSGSGTIFCPPESPGSLSNFSDDEMKNKVEKTGAFFAFVRNRVQGKGVFDPGADRV